MLNENKITHIINVTKNVPCFFKNSSDLKIEYLKVEVDDTSTEDIGKHFLKTYKYIGKRQFQN